MENSQVPDILGGIDGGRKPPEFTEDQLKAYIICFMDTGDPLAAALRAGLQNPEESIMITVDRLQRHPAIKAGLAALQSLKRDTAPIRVTRDSLIEECQQIGEKALGDRQYTSSLAAVKLKAQLTGHLEEKVRVIHENNPKKLSDAELERIASGERPVIDIDPKTGEAPAKAD